MISRITVGRKVVSRVLATVKTALYLRHVLFGIWLAATVRRRSGPIPERESVHQLLVIRLDGLGDWLLTSAFLRELRRHYTKARITVIASSTVKPLVELCPYIDEYIPYPLHLAPLPFDQVRAWWRARRFARGMEARRYDMAIIPRWEIDDPCALGLAYMLDVPVRIGYGSKVTPLKAIKNAGYDRLLTHIVPPGTDLHEAACSLNIIKYIGGTIADSRLEAWLSESDLAVARSRLGAVRLSGRRKIVAVAPGASLDKKRWPVECFRKLVADLVASGSVCVVLIGAAEDQGIAADILAGGWMPSSQVIDLTGLLRMRQTLAVLGECHLLIGNDSGPCHMAASVGTSVVMISSQVSGGHPVLGHPPQRYHPWCVSHRVVQPIKAQPPCVDRCQATVAHCIRGIAVTDVARAAAELLASDGQHPDSYRPLPHQCC